MSNGVCILFHSGVEQILGQKEDKFVWGYAMLIVFVDCPDAIVQQTLYISSGVQENSLGWRLF